MVEVQHGKDWWEEQEPSWGDAEWEEAWGWLRLHLATCDGPKLEENLGIAFAFAVVDEIGAFAVGGAEEVVFDVDWETMRETEKQMDVAEEMEYLL